MDQPSKKETMMFVALPGTEPYAEVPKKQVKDQLDKGLLKQSALIWSQKHNSWKQARHITQLIASKLQPRPAQAPLATNAQPKVSAHPAAKPAVAKAPAVAKVPSVPKTAAKPAAVKSAKAPHTAATDTTVEGDLTGEGAAHRTPMWLKAVCAALVVIILALGALNWYYVDHALKSNLAEDNTPFKDVPVFAHLAGFFQVNVIVIHLRPTDKVTHDNFTQYLAAVANATPDRPMSTLAFGTVSLASGWGADYYISGRNWRRLAKPDITDDERRAILIEGVYTSSGDKLVPKSNLDASGQQALEVKRWNDFITTFVRK